MNEHIIDDKQPLYEPIYILNLVELKTLKIYIKTYLKTTFIQSFKTFATAPILFSKMSDSNFCLSVDYQGLNNLTIKNRYLSPLIGEILDWLSRAKQLTKLDITGTYY